MEGSLFVCNDFIVHLSNFHCAEWKTSPKLSLLQVFSLEFEYHGTMCIVFLRFWKMDHLTKVQLRRYILTEDTDSAQLSAKSRLLDCLHVWVYHWDDGNSKKSSLFKKGVKYPFRFNALSLPSMMFPREGSVFGRTDLLTMMKYILTFIGSCLNQRLLGSDLGSFL